MIMVTYVILVTGAAIGIFAACRAIDHHFEKKEMSQQHGYNACLIDGAFRDIEYLTDDMIKKINDQLFNLTKAEDQ